MMSCYAECLPRVAFVLLWLSVCGCLPSGQSMADEEKEPHFLEGRSRVNSMDYEGAIQSFENALIANPRSASAHFELGWLYDQRKGEPATAIYHYGRFLDAHPSAEKAERARKRIMACKQELASTVALAPVAQNLQHEFDQLTEENRRLREENERWRAYFLRARGQTNAPSAIVSQSAPPASSGAAARNPEVNSNRVRPATTAPAEEDATAARTSSVVHASATRTHTVKSGETPSAIARKYNIRVGTLMAANPRLDARRMQVGQTLNIPVN